MEGFFLSPLLILIQHYIPPCCNGCRLHAAAVCFAISRRCQCLSRFTPPEAYSDPDEASCLVFREASFVIGW